MLPFLMLLSLQVSAPDIDADAASRMMDEAAAHAHAAADLVIAEDKALRANSRWFFLTEDRDRPWFRYADRATIVARADGISMWSDLVLADNVHSKTLSYSWKSQSVYDCSGQRARVMAVVVSRSDGTTQSTDYSEGTWTPVVPDSVGETDLRFACGKVDGWPIGPTTPESDAPSRLAASKVAAIGR